MGEKEIRKQMRKRWCGIKQRCLNPRALSYRFYGAKGITLSKRWLSFEQFYLDMADGFESHLQIDRIDPYRGYSKSNCRWITKEENINRVKRKPQKLSLKKEIEIQSLVRNVRDVFPDLIFLLKKEGYSQVDTALILNCTPQKVRSTINSVHCNFKPLLVRR
jgi:hypothetical protein